MASGGWLAAIPAIQIIYMVLGRPLQDQVLIVTHELAFVRSGSSSF